MTERRLTNRARGGLARVASIFKRARAECSGEVLVLKAPGRSFS